MLTNMLCNASLHAHIFLYTFKIIRLFLNLKICQNYEHFILLYEFIIIILCLEIEKKKTFHWFKLRQFFFLV